MELFTPDIGLVLWMLIPFSIVFFVLAKYAWPAIIKGIEERGKFIDDSIQAANEANARLEGIKAEGDQLLAEARAEQLRLLKEASDMHAQLIREAKQQAGVEADKVLAEARAEIQREKEQAVRDIRSQVAELSLDIAEKVLRKNLDNKAAQMELVDKLLEESVN
jgi:F-type H+-transporting ATPase subunit b